MKSEKGITLITLIIYMIAMLIILSILALVTANFNMNSNYITEKGKYIAEFNKFNMIFISDCKKNRNTTNVSDSEILFEDGTTYKFLGNEIYRNEQKICNEINICKFAKTQTNVNNCTKNIIRVSIQIGGTEVFATTTEYVLKYW